MTDPAEQPVSHESVRRGRPYLRIILVLIAFASVTLTGLRAGCVVPQMARSDLLRGFAEAIMTVLPDCIARQGIESAMRSEHWDVSAVAYGRATAMEYETAVRLLLRELEDEDESIHRGAAVWFEEVASRNRNRPDLIPVLVKWMLVEEEDLALCLVRAMVEFREDMRPFLADIDLRLDVMEDAIKLYAVSLIVEKVKPKRKRYIQFLIDFIPRVGPPLFLESVGTALIDEALQAFTTEFQSRDLAAWQVWWETEKEKDYWEDAE